MINQGYSYKVINKLGDLENENLFYTKKEEQHELLKDVLSANESAVDEDDTGNLRAAGSSQITRTGGTMSSLSGGDEGLYMDVRRNQASKDKSHHPLFKKFFFGGSKK